VKKGEFLKIDFAKSTPKQQKNCQNELLNACPPQIFIAHFTQMRKISPQIHRKYAQINQIPLPKSPKNLLNYLR